jgi:23S rRNA (guanine2445-N2)-methyltransferase / 23S rRNA (guanine2069-N7)-methyltransferase
MNNLYNLFASTAKGVEPILVEELQNCGAADCRVTAGGVHFTGTIATALRACLWSRTASRVHLYLGQFHVENTGDMYSAVQTIPWEDHMAPAATVAVDFNGTGSGISNTMYGAQLVKDALVDRVRDRRGSRPSVNPEMPDLLVNCHLARNELGVRIDLSGGSLHLRGYRREAGAAPLKENLAAALLLKAGWPSIAADGGAYLDPLCGSGTLVIEAALIAADAAPGLYRAHWGFRGWTGHDQKAWQDLVDEANARRESGLNKASQCYGYDGDKQVVKIARHNAQRANIQSLVQFETRMLQVAEPKEGVKPGLVLANPPYGKRLGEADEVSALYAELGDVLKRNFRGWHAAVFTGEPELGKRMGLRAHKVNVFYNGPLACQLLQFRVEPDRFVDRDALDKRAADKELDQALRRGADAFLNRVRKNMRTIGRWAGQEGIQCFRLYDADLPEYAAAVDIYGEWVHVQEYSAPSTIDERKAEERLNDMLTVLPHALEIKKEHIVLKVRRRQKGKRQYDKFDDQKHFIEVHEGSRKFLVNLTDYLDTGLFLDHRLTREMIGSMADGKRFLNLFCYTGTATVYAAQGGAKATTSVDMSPTYVEWARRNLERNGITGNKHRLIHDDCLEWIGHCGERFDLIFLDPPTFSNSKRMHKTLDVQRDHVSLIGETARLLTPGGILIFSTNKLKFKLDTGALSGYRIEDLSSKTLPRDFARNPRIHSCWKIMRGE